MKKPIATQNNSNVTSSSRRQMIKGVAAGATLALLPASRMLAATQAQAAATSGSPSLAMGYLHRGGEAADVVLDASTLGAASGTFECRIAGVETDVALAMDAHYLDGAYHRFWQAWSERGLLQRSPTSSIRWSAESGGSLPLKVSVRNEAAMTRMVAQPGTYVLAIGPQTQRLPAWSKLALRPKAAGENDNLELVWRADGTSVKFPYALFTVRRISA